MSCQMVGVTVFFVLVRLLVVVAREALFVVAHSCWLVCISTIPLVKFVFELVSKMRWCYITLVCLLLLPHARSPQGIAFP